MKLIVTIEIPRETTVGDAGDVVEFLTGLGTVDMNLAARRITGTFEPLDQPVMDISAAIVQHTVQEIERVSVGGIEGADRASIKLAVSAGLGLLDRWDEILAELASRGWNRPTWEIRA